MPQSQTRIYGLEYGRAVAVLFVLLWHEHIFGRGRMFYPETAFPAWPSISDVLYSNVLLQAVPFFIFISCFLYASKDPTRASLSARTKKLITLHCFWAVTYFLVLGGVPSLLGAFSTFQIRPLYALFTGMGSYYFFSALLVTTIATHFASRLGDTALWACLIGSLLSITGMQVAAITGWNTWAAAFWNPLNYLPTAPAAVLLVRYTSKDKIAPWFALGATAFFVLSAILEWLLLPGRIFISSYGYAMPAYTRISPMIFSVVATLLLLRIRSPAPAWVTFLAKYSLSVYCLQAFVITWTSPLAQAPILKTAVDLAITYGLALFLHKAIFRNGLLAADRP
ncbi:hypothetical protein LMG26685_02166 [Achromobacter mucicolens]|uniref:acyltransferase family protein n=1 Tax=Achromobacter mucicolens TaxID=1389922 RepID=UPI0009CDB0F7|nr:acyltransferase family protein [Achromobacter mucicolens]OXC91361.1 hypothetical protein BMR85_009620 [Achromobacter sp. KAs 3-5]CAB3643518.1 hypothetical protein LMG26685_02166 [Achromobacter mucicolens]